MSLFSDLKFFIKKYLKNPVLITAAAYILYKFINDKKKKESFCEAVKILDDSNDRYSLIYDENSNKFILIIDNEVFSASTEEEINIFLKNYLKGDNNGT